MCDICQVDSILSKYMGSETARSMPIERIREDDQQGYRIGFGGYWITRELASSLEEAIPKVEDWVYGFAKKIFASQLGGEDTESGVIGRTPVPFSIEHNGESWDVIIAGESYVPRGNKMRLWIEGLRETLDVS